MPPGAPAAPVGEPTVRPDVPKHKGKRGGGVQKRAAASAGGIPAARHPQKGLDRALNSAWRACTASQKLSFMAGVIHKEPTGTLLQLHGLIQGTLLSRRQPIPSVQYGFGSQASPAQATANQQESGHPKGGKAKSAPGSYAGRAANKAQNPRRAAQGSAAPSGNPAASAAGAAPKGAQPVPKKAPGVSTQQPPLWKRVMNNVRRTGPDAAAIKADLVNYDVQSNNLHAKLTKERQRAWSLYLRAIAVFTTGKDPGLDDPKILRKAPSTWCTNIRQWFENHQDKPAKMAVGIYRLYSSMVVKCVKHLREYAKAEADRKELNNEFFISMEQRAAWLIAADVPTRSQAAPCRDLLSWFDSSVTLSAAMGAMSSPGVSRSDDTADVSSLMDTSNTPRESASVEADLNDSFLSGGDEDPCSLMRRQQKAAKRQRAAKASAGRGQNNSSPQGRGNKFPKRGG